MKRAIRWILVALVVWLVYRLARGASASPVKGTSTSGTTGSSAPTPGAGEPAAGDVGILLADVFIPKGGYPTIDAYGNVSTVTPPTTTAQPPTGGMVPLPSGNVGPAPAPRPPGIMPRAVPTTTATDPGYVDPNTLLPEPPARVARSPYLANKLGLDWLM